jgi:hypothetical protein
MSVWRTGSPAPAACSQFGTATQDGHSEGGQLSKLAAFMTKNGALIAAFGGVLSVAWLAGGEYVRIRTSGKAQEERAVLSNKAQEERAVLSNKAQEERQKALEEKLNLSAQLTRAESQAELAKMKADILQNQLNLGFHGSYGNWRQARDAGNKDP